MRGRTRTVADQHALADTGAGLGDAEQFCPNIGIDTALRLASGDTRVTARVTDVLGQPGVPASIIIRVP